MLLSCENYLQKRFHCCYKSKPYFIRMLSLCCYNIMVQLIMMQVCTTTTVRANTDGFIVGNKIETLTGRFRREVGIFMNFRSPSPQTGVVTSWNFHYNCVPRVNRYHATLMMYRLNSANSQYQVLPESIQSISVECLDTGVTLSRNRTLMVEEQFSIEEGDIAAICLPNDDTEPLRIVSMLNPFRNGVRNVLELSINQGEGCSIDRLQTINIQGLRLRRNLQLNFYAEAIAVPKTLTTTDDPYSADIATSTIQTDTSTVSHVSPTSTTNTTIMVSRFDRLPDLSVIKLTVISLSPVVMATVMIVIVILVIVVAVMWRRRQIRHKNSFSSTTVDELECSNCYNCSVSMEFNMNDNVSYNVCDADASSQHYEYPDLSTTILDESNIYDSIDSQ